MIEDLVLRVVVYGLIPTIATVFGSVLVFLRVSLDERFIDVALGFGSGLMVYVAFVELLIPSIEIGGLRLSLLGFTLGFILIKSIDVFIPHTWVVRKKENRNLVLVALAIAIHNIPEGLAVGATSIHSPEAGLATAIAIAVQDVPEGLIVSLSVVASSRKASLGFLAGVLSAVSEFFSAIASLIGLVDTAVTLPVLLALSASAMLYVVVHEVAPEIFGHEHDEYATLGFVAGLLTGMVI
ncbi:MAG: ZIP family metal transporter [Sulfolobales archaeon]